MKAITAHHIGEISKKGTVQVICLVGEGSSQRSVTRHAVQVRGVGLVGNNPDERVTKMHQDANAVVIDTRDEKKVAEERVTKLEKNNADAEVLKTAREAARAATGRFSAAQERLARVEANFPLQVQFV